MNIVSHLQELDNLIVELTRPPVTAKLRNKVSLITEEAEAYQAASDKQDAALANQAKTIERLMEENQKLVAENSGPAPDLVSHKGAFFRRKPEGGYYDDVLCRECKQPMVSFMREHNYSCDRCVFG